MINEKEQRERGVSLTGSIKEGNTHEADNDIIKSLEKAGEELLGYAQELKILQKQRDDAIEKIKIKEEENRRDSQRITIVREKIKQRGEEKKEYEKLLADEERNLHNLNREITELKSRVEKSQQEDISLEQQIAELTKSRFAPLYQNSHLKILIENGFASSIVSLEEVDGIPKEITSPWLEPSEYKPEIEISDFLDLGQNLVDKSFEDLVHRVNSVIKGIIASVGKVSDYYKAVDKITEERKRLAQEGEKYIKVLGEKESAYDLKQKEAEKLKIEYEEVKSELEKLSEEDDQLTVGVKKRDEEIYSAQRFVERIEKNSRTSLIKDLRRKELVQAIAPLLLRDSESIEEIMSSDTRNMVLTSPATTEELIGEEVEDFNLKAAGLNEVKLEEPFSQLYVGFEYEGFNFLVFNGMAFIKYVRDIIGEMYLLREKSLRSLKNSEDTLQWGRTRIKFSEKTDELTRVLNNVILSYNLGLQQKISSLTEGKETSNYDLNEENWIFDDGSVINLVSPILKIIKTLVYSPSNESIPNGGTFIDLKTYFAADGRIEPRFDVIGEHDGVLKEVKDFCENMPSHSESKMSEYDSSLKKQVSRLAQLVKMDLTPSTQTLQLPPYPERDK